MLVLDQPIYKLPYLTRTSFMISLLERWLDHFGKNFVKTIDFSFPDLYRSYPPFPRGLLKLTHLSTIETSITWEKEQEELIDRAR